MKYVTSALLVAVGLGLSACAGDSAKKNDTASKAAATAPTTRCPAGYAQDYAGNCVEQQTQTRRRQPVRDTLGRDMGELSFPQPMIPTGGLLGR